MRIIFTPSFKYKIIFLGLLSLYFSINSFAQNIPWEKVSVQGKNISYCSYGLQTRKPNEPVLVFESGLGGGGGSFLSLLNFLNTKTAGVAYDRNGLGGSESDARIKTDKDVVIRLHDLLTTLHISPPYLLVGHSLGGPFIRLFTALYPQDVAGLVFIDPTDYMLTKTEDEKVKTATSSALGYRELWAVMLDKMSKDTTVSPGARAEMKRELTANGQLFFPEMALLPELPNIPVAILIAYNKHIERPEQQLSDELKINIIPWFKELDRLRVTHYADMIAFNQNSNLILLPRYSHGIHNQDPNLVANAILSVYHSCLLKQSNK